MPQIDSATSHDGQDAPSTPPVSDDDRPRKGFFRTLIGRPDLGAAVVGLVFLLESWRPSLLPRPPVVQGVLSALLLLVGYGIGGLILRAGRSVLARTRTPMPGARERMVGRWVVIALTILAVVVGSVVWRRWQNGQRELVAMEQLDGSAVATMVVALVAVTVIVLAIARVIGFVVGRIDRWMVRRIGTIAGHALVTVAVVVLVVGGMNRVVIRGVVQSVHDTFGEGNETTAPGIEQTTSALQSGGPGSLVPWKSLGFQGRTFIGGTTTERDLQSFAGPGAKVVEPIRVYVGLDSASSPKARAALAVRELERTGAFKRSVLCVATVTGTGWINPRAADALEYLRNGDSAIVGMQYSYLPSWISFLVDGDNATAAGKALNDAVYAKWSTLPEATRPKLIVFGESLGSLGSEPAFHEATARASVDAATSRSSSVLWVAPPNSNPVWSQLTAARDRGTPVWLPVYDGGREVRFVARGAQLPISTIGGPSTITYLQHPSDPVTWWELSTLWKPPEWTHRPLGTDLPRQVSWFPIVTWAQTSFDLIEGFSTPPGHGHNFNNMFASAFASMVAPPGWTRADNARLEKVLAGASPGEPSY